MSLNESRNKNFGFGLGFFVLRQNETKKRFVQTQQGTPRRPPRPRQQRRRARRGQRGGGKEQQRQVGAQPGGRFSLCHGQERRSELESHLNQLCTNHLFADRRSHARKGLGGALVQVTIIYTTCDDVFCVSFIFKKTLIPVLINSSRFVYFRNCVVCCLPVHLIEVLKCIFISHRCFLFLIVCLNTLT